MQNNIYETLKKLFNKIGKNDEVKLQKPRVTNSVKADWNFKNLPKNLTKSGSILYKMVAMFLLLIIIPVATIGFIATRTSSNNLTKSAEDSLEAATKLTSGYFEVFLDKAQDLTVQVIANQQVQKYSMLNRETVEAYDALVIQRDAANAINSMNSSTTDMEVKLLYENGDVLGGDGVSADYKGTGWYKKVKEADGKAVIVDSSEGSKGQKSKNVAISVSRIYKDPRSSGEMGLILVDVNYTSVSKILSGIDLGLKDSTYLITSEGRVLAEDRSINDSDLAKRQFVQDVIKRSAKNVSGIFYTVDGGVNYLVSFNKSAKTGITAVTNVPTSEITSGVTQIVDTTILTGVLFIILASVFGFVFSLRMTKSMKSLMGAMSKAEAGDLAASLTMKRKDEIGKLVASYNKMIGNIRELVIDSKRASDEVVATSVKMASISSESSRISTEIAHAIVEVASGSSNQASEVESSVKNVSQLADRITLAVERTKAMEADAESMKEISDYGISTIDNLKRKTAETNEIAANVVIEIGQLNKYVKNINVITNVLRSIADQTNLLALNAAIEAARAGEAGKGFAVVADEIRKLAEQSNNHTRDIQKHIENVFKQSQSSTDLVAKAEISFREQSDIVGQTAEAFSKINNTTSVLAENINRVGDMIIGMDSYKEKVMSSMENISAVSEQVSASTQEVSASTEEQLASIEQLDDMAKQLHELAEDLISRMEMFKV